MISQAQSLRTSLRVRNSVAQISAYADAHKTTHKLLITLLINNAKKKYIVSKKYLSLQHNSKTK